MSIRAEAKFDLGALARELSQMGHQAPLIMARSLTRAATAGKTAMAAAVRKDTGLMAKYVDREIVLDRANRTDLRAALTIKGSRIPLIAFRARGPEPSRGKGRGVSYHLAGGAGRVSNAFIATMGSGHRGVFKRPGSLGRKSQGPRGYVDPRSGSARAGSGRLPIVELRGPSLPFVFEKNVETFRVVAEESLVKNLRHEIDFSLSKAAAAASPAQEMPIAPVGGW